MSADVEPTPSSQEKSDSLPWASLVMLFIGTGAVLLSIGEAQNVLSWVIMLVLGVTASQFYSIMLHESAHAMVGALVGLKPLRVCCGRGPMLFQHRINGGNFILKAIPTSGHTLFFYPDRPHLRTRIFLMVLAGPLANAILAIGAALLIWYPPEWWNRHGLESKCLPLMVFMFLSNSIMVVTNLFPRLVLLDGVPTQTDGMRMIRIPFLKQAELDQERSMSEYMQALENAKEALSSSAATEATAERPSPFWNRLLEGMQAGDPALLFRYTLQNYQLSPQARAQALDTFATWVLFEGASQHLAEAERYSEELIRKQPNSWSVKGTRGSILIEHGSLAEGIKMLREVMGKDPSSFDRAISACFLALGELKQNRIAEAEEWLEKARHLDAHCVPLKRIQKLLERHKQSLSP